MSKTNWQFSQWSNSVKSQSTEKTTKWKNRSNSNSGERDAVINKVSINPRLSENRLEIRNWPKSNNFQKSLSKIKLNYYLRQIPQLQRFLIQFINRKISQNYENDGTLGQKSNWEITEILVKSHQKYDYPKITKNGSGKNGRSVPCV